MTTQTGRRVSFWIHVLAIGCCVYCVGATLVTHQWVGAAVNATLVAANLIGMAVNQRNAELHVAVLRQVNMQTEVSAQLAAQVGTGHIGRIVVDGFDDDDDDRDDRPPARPR